MCIVRIQKGLVFNIDIYLAPTAECLSCCQGFSKRQKNQGHQIQFNYRKKMSLLTVLFRRKGVCTQLELSHMSHLKDKSGSLEYVVQPGAREKTRIGPNVLKQLDPVA